MPHDGVVNTLSTNKMASTNEKTSTYQCDWYHLSPRRIEGTPRNSHDSKQKGEIPVYVALSSNGEQSDAPFYDRQGTLVSMTSRFGSGQSYGNRTTNEAYFLPSLTGSEAKSGISLPTKLQQKNKKLPLLAQMHSKAYQNFQNYSNRSEHSLPAGSQTTKQDTSGNSLESQKARIAKFKALLIPKHQAELEKQRVFREQYALKQKVSLNLKQNKIKPLKSEYSIYHLQTDDKENIDKSKTVQKGYDSKTSKKLSKEASSVQKQIVTNTNQDISPRSIKGTERLPANSPSEGMRARRDKSSIHIKEKEKHLEQNPTKDLPVVDLNNLNHLYGNRNSQLWFERNGFHFVGPFEATVQSEVEYPRTKTNQNMPNAKNQNDYFQSELPFSQNFLSSLAPKRCVMRKFKKLDVFEERKGPPNSPVEPKIIAEVSPREYMPITREPTYKMDLFFRKQNRT